MAYTRRLSHSLFILLQVLIFVLPLWGQVSVTMRHNDIGQTGRNNAETTLKPSNVVNLVPRYIYPLSGDTVAQACSGTLGFGDMYAQVLVVAMNINGGFHKVAIAVTGRNHVYAFDAENGTTFWCLSLGNPVPHTGDIPDFIGIIGTPVVDPGTNTLYVVAKTLEGNRNVFRLHALDIANEGAERFGAPIELYAFVQGNGAGSNQAGTIFFDPEHENQRPGLTLNNGAVYIGFAAHEDVMPYHGWVLAYDARNLLPDPLNTNQLPKAVFNTTANNARPNVGGGGIWMSGQAPVIDSSGNLYALTGNMILANTDCPLRSDGTRQPGGFEDTEADANTYGESYIKLAAKLSPSDYFKTLQVSGYFKPFNAYDLDCADSDVSSGGAMEIPGTSYIVGGGKQGRLFVINENAMGGYHPPDPATNDPGKDVPPSFDAQSGLIFSSPVWFNNRIYLWGTDTVVKAWNWNGTQFDPTPALFGPSTVKTPPGYSANAELAISSDGESDGIVWALAPTTDPNSEGQLYGSLGILYAFDATTLQCLYASASKEGCPSPSPASLATTFNYAKYDVPTVANGKVFVPTRSGEVVVYGLRPKIRAVRPLSTPPIPMVNQPYSFATVDSTDPSIEIPVNFNFNGDLPPGMSFFSDTGLLSGTPTTPGLFDFVVTANYSDAPSVTQEYALSVCQVDPSPPNLAVTIPINSPYVIGNINSNPLGIYKFYIDSGGLPPGMALNENTGMVSGTPIAAGTYNAKITTSLPVNTAVSPLMCPSGTATSDLFYQITVSCSGTQCQPQYEGYFDGLNSDNIWGWAWDRTQADSPIQVDIYDSSFDVVPDGTPALASVNANLFRQDLLNAGKGDGFHAFVFPVPQSLKDGQVHRIHVTFAGTKTDLGWSPRLLLAPPPAQRFVGLHASNSCDRIDGFAVDTWQSNVPIDVNVFDGSDLLAVLNANLDASLVPATLDHGTHGFLYFIPDRLKDGAVHQIRISFAVSGVALSNTNQTLSCAPPSPPTQTPAYGGFFDNATCTRVDGWGWDANRPDTPVDVNVYADGSRVATLTANLFSQDLLDKNIGNGAHRFVFFVPSLMKDGGPHHFSVQIAAQGTDLPISSAAGTEDITCAALPPPQPPPPAPIVNTNTGTGVGMSSGQPTGITPAIDVTFASVFSPGVTSFVSVDPSIVGRLPDGYAYPHAAINPVAFEISTTAAYGGPVSVTFRVPSETDAAEFALLRILHLENGTWVDRTLLAPDPQAPNFGLHTVTAQVSSFSPFVLAQLIQNPITSNVALTGSGNSTYGQAIAFNARVSGLGSSATPAGTVTFTDGGQILAAVPLDSSGQAAVSTALLGAGTHTILVSYSGDSVFPQATGQFVQVVNPAPLSVSADSAVRFYGSSNPVFTGTISGLQNNDNVTASFQSATSAFSPAGLYPITITLSDPNRRLGNYSVSEFIGRLTVSPAVLTITTNNKSRPYGQPNPALDGAMSGVVNGDAITVTFTSPADQFSPLGVYGITPVISDPGNKLVNYDVNSVDGTLTVTAAFLQITAHNKSRNYGSANPVFDGDISGVLNNDGITATYTSAATPSSPVGAYGITPVVNDPNGKLGNYNVAIQNGILTITPTMLVVSANNKSRIYGQPNPALDGTISGLQNGDSISATYSTTATATSPVGTYDIMVALSDPTNKLSNYAVTLNNGLLTVSAATLTVTPNHKSRLYGAPNPALDGVITGVQNGDNITATFSTSATPASSIGNYPIVAALVDPGNKLGNYNVTLNTDTLTVTPAPLLVTANNKTKIYGQVVPALDGTVSGIQNGDRITATFTTSATQSSPVGSYAIVAALQDPGQRLSNYVVTTNNGTLSVLAAPLVITADNKTKILNAPNPPFTASYTGFVLGEGPNILSGTLTCTAAATTNSIVGNYPITCSGQSSGNYAISYTPGTLTILYAASGVCAGSPGHQVLAPVAADGTSVFNQGRTVPVKFRVCDANGISIGIAGVVNSFTIVQEISGTVADVNVDVPSSTPDAAFRWDPSGQQWIFNVDTSTFPNNITLVFRIALNDGSAIGLQFGLK